MTQPQPMQSMLPAGALDYARDGPSRRRTRRRRLLLLLSIAIVIAGVAWWWREPLMAHAQLHHAQDRCANHEFPPGTLVASTRDWENEFAAPFPVCWTDYDSHGRLNAVANVNRQRFARSLAFLHRLRSPSGEEKIIALYCYPLYLSSGSILHAFEVVSVTPANFWSFSSKPAALVGIIEGGYPYGTKVEVFGGQMDPANPSRFTIDYKKYDVPGVIEGQLLDSGVVILKLRSGSPTGMDRYRSKAP